MDVWGRVSEQLDSKVLEKIKHQTDPEVLYKLLLAASSGDKDEFYQILEASK